MTNKQKIKGTAWENDLVDLLSSKIDGATVKRIPGSGAIGTILGESSLTGDLIARFPGFPKQFRIEAKVGYGGEKQLTIQREWLNKIKEEAENSYSIPTLACKFSGARKSGGVQYFVVLDLDTFCDIVNRAGVLKESLDDLLPKALKEANEK